MPNPSREAFNAAAKKVMETAPEGLSREQFFDLIDKELAPPVATRNPLILGRESARMSGREGEGVEHEPDTYWGGFWKGIKDYTHDLAKGSLESQAQPQNMGDFLQLLIPSETAMAPMPLGKAVINREKDAMGRMPEGLPLYKKPGAFIKNLKDLSDENIAAGGRRNRVFRDLPLSEQMDYLGPEGNTPHPSNRGGGPPIMDRPAGEPSWLDRFKANQGGVPDKGVPQDPNLPASTESMVDRYMPNEGGAPDGGLPNIDNRIMPQGAFNEMPLSSQMEHLPELPAPQGGRTVPPDIPQVPFHELPLWKQMQQGGFDAGGEAMAEHPGASSSPRVPPESPPGIEGLDSRISNLPPESAPVPLDEYMQHLLVEHDPGAMAGRAQDLRGNLGSRDAARQMFGSGNPTTQDWIRKMSPGPSRIPLEAEERIQEALRRALEGDSK